MSAPAPTRSPVPPGHAVLVYDADCRFCTRVARWFETHAALEVLSFDQVPRERMLAALTEGALAASAHFVTPEGVEYHGGAAMTAALRLTRLAPLAAALDCWPFAREAAYAAVARSRGLLSRLVG